MAKKRGAQGSSNGYRVPKLPTIEELRRAYEQGLPQTLLSGVEVKMHPLQPDKLLMAGNIPDMLTPLIIKMLFPPKEGGYRFPDEVNEFMETPRDEIKEALEFVRSVDAVCASALVDPSIVPYLAFEDRLWIFKLAFYPVEVLSSFRLKSPSNVGLETNEQGDGDTTERAAAVDSESGQAQPVHELSL